jgi:hypothetical protein
MTHLLHRKAQISVTSQGPQSKPKWVGTCYQRTREDLVPLTGKELETIFPTKTGWSCPTSFTPSLPMWKAHSLYLDATFTNKKVSGTNHSGMEM